MHIGIRAGNAIVSHRDEELIFYWNYYSKQNTENVFIIFNKYLTSLSEVKHDKLFEVFSKASDTFRNPPATINEISEILSKIVKEMYDILSIDNYRNWALRERVYAIPSDLGTTYGRFSPETTYLVDDYVGLLHLATLLKPMSLIFGEFISRYKDNVGNDHKETITLPLLSMSAIVDTPEYEKLTTFVQATTVKASSTVNAVAGGIGSSSIANWQLASIIIRKIAPALVDSPNDSLIKKIHGHIDNNVKKISLENRGKGGRGGVKLTERSLTSKSTEEEISVIDSHRLKQLYPTHIPIVGEVYLLDTVDDEDGNVFFVYPENVRKLVVKIDPEFPIDVPVPNGEDIQRLEGVEITDYHLQIIALLTKKIIPPKVLINLSYMSIMVLIVAVHVIIYRWGFHDLAHIIIAKSEKISDNMLVDISILKVTQDSNEKLSSIYRHYSPTNKRQLTHRTNVGTEFINRTIQSMTGLQHHYNNPPMTRGGKSNGKYLKIPKTIARELAEFLIYLHTSSVNKVS